MPRAARVESPVPPRTKLVLNVHLVVNGTRIVRGGGVYLRRESHAAPGGQR